MPDSLVREFAAYLQSFNNSDVDTSKFKFTDKLINGTDLRVSYEIWRDISMENDDYLDSVTKERKKEYLRGFLDQFNIRAANTSVQILDWYEYAWFIPKQTNRPDAFLFNAANAHALYRQKSWMFRKWMQDLNDLLTELPPQPAQEGNPKLFWYGNPYFRGTAHEGTEHITQSRSALFNRITQYVVNLLPDKTSHTSPGKSCQESGSSTLSTSRRGDPKALTMDYTTWLETTRKAGREP